MALAEGATLTLEDVAEFLRGAGLRTQAIPEQLEVVDAVLRNPAGKILKHALRERFGAAVAGSRASSAGVTSAGAGGPGSGGGG